MILEWFSRFLPGASRSKEHPQGKPTVEDVSEAGTTDVVNGILASASNFVINGAHMFDHPQIFQTIHNTVTTGAAALDRLLPHTCPDAAVDSSARDPPPRCHPGTRQRILNALDGWLTNHLWKIFWLSGPAGTGKSAVAQTFAEICLERGRLGAAYFFFRSSGRSNPQTLIPSLAYQLAVNVPDYGHLLAYAIARDPSIFQKTPRVQLRRLIVEPITRLQAQGHEMTRSPLLIVLDGLDECDGIQAQCEIVEMIGEIVRLKNDLPLLWLIASRPEPHLQYVFSRADFSIQCSKEMLLIDADTRDDVDRYLRDSFNDIRTRFPLVTDDNWPSEVDSRRVEDIASGFFALAATIVRYISDITHGDPMGRLAYFLAFMSNADHVATTNPLQTLDLLYTQVLSKIPENVYPMTRRILVLHVSASSPMFSLQIRSNFLRMNKSEIYNALNKLHSLFDIPSPDKGIMGILHMHHASFDDYLRTPFRSGRFYISLREVFIEYVKICFSWYKTILEDPRFVSDDSLGTIAASAVVPGLKWTSSDNGNDLLVSRSIVAITCSTIWIYFSQIPEIDAEFLDQLEGLEDFDFRYMLVSMEDRGLFSKVVEWLFSWGPRNGILHPEPQDELGRTLLDKVIHEIGLPMEPAVFPMIKTNDCTSPYRYLFIGHGMRTSLFWFDDACVLKGRCRLSCKALPGEKYTASDCVIHLPELL